MSSDILIPDELFRPMQLTPLSQTEAFHYLHEGWKLIFQNYPDFKQLRILWAHTALETANFGICRNLNLGNIKKTPGHFWTMYRSHEYDAQGNIHIYDPPHIQTGFNAYTDPLLAAKEYIEFLKNRSRYVTAWAQLVNGNAKEYIYELGNHGYFSAPPDKYYANVMYWLKIFDANYQKFLDAEPKLPPKEDSKPPEEPPKEPLPPPISGKYQEPGFWDRIFILLRNIFLNFR